MQIMKETTVAFISVASHIFHCFFLSGSASGNIRWCTSQALGKLFKAICDPQSVVVSFRLGWSPLFCPAGFPSAQGPGMVLLMSESTASTTSTCLQRRLLVQLGGQDPWLTPSRHCSVLVFPFSSATCLCLSQITSNNV